LGKIAGASGEGAVCACCRLSAEDAEVAAMAGARMKKRIKVGGASFMRYGAARQCLLRKVRKGVPPMLELPEAHYTLE
jgi:hypothetical protein